MDRSLTALVLLLCMPAALGQPAALRVAVVAPGDDHHAWVAASRLSLLARGQGLALDVETAPPSVDVEPAPDLYVMPARSLAPRVPALEALELPFFFSGLPAVHRSLDGELGEELRARAREAGWEILAFWDEGLHVMSGLRRYDSAVNLTGMEFVLLRPDPVAERQFSAWNASTRQIRPRNLDELAAECVVSSRAGTLQALQRERVDRVHLTLALTRHRYEGWLLLAAGERWRSLTPEHRRILERAVIITTDWQRDEVARRETEALADLRRRGMEIHTMDAGEREEFLRRLPAWTSLMSDGITPTVKQRLLASASARAAPGSGASTAQPVSDATRSP